MSDAAEESKQPESKEEEEAKDNSKLAQLLARAKDTPKKDETETLSSDPNKETNEKTQAQKEREEDAALQRELEESGQVSNYLKVAQFVLVTGFSFLMIIAIGAIIFYLLDWAASIFDFDLGSYTQYIILALSGLNIMMSCCGCYGTWKLSDLDKKNTSRLKKVTAAIKGLADGIGKDNKDLQHTLGKLQVKIDHFNNENQEARQTLRQIEKQEADFIKERKNEADLYVSLRELWNLWKTYQTFGTIANITKVTSEYYKYAYQDGDMEHGLDKEQFDQLVRSPAVPMKHRKFFPPFEHKVWKIEGRRGNIPNGDILVDEFERVLVLIYKNVLREELQVQMKRQERKRGDVSLKKETQSILDREQNDKSGLNQFF